MKKLTEASVNLNISDLNSSDMQALSQILSLAGQAEQASSLMNGSSMGGISGMDTMGGMVGADLSGVTPMAGPDSGFEPEVELDTGLDTEFEPEIDVLSIDEPLGDEFDIDLGLDTDGDMSALDMEMMETFNRVYHLAGMKLSESDEDEEDVLIENPLLVGAAVAAGTELGKRVGSEIFDEDCDEDEEEFDNDVKSWMRESIDSINDMFDDEDEIDQLDENAEGMYNIDIDEDAAAELSSPGIGDNRIFGPYQNEMGAMIDARKEIPGAMRDREVRLVHKPEGYYWSKINEDMQNSRPKIQDVCTKGVRSDKHAQNKVPGKVGDNTLVDVMESENVDILAKQLNEQYNRFIKGE